MTAAGVSFYGPLGRLTRRMAASVLVGQSVAVFFAALVARALAALDVGAPRWHLWSGVGLAVACIVTAGLLRRPWGVTLGWLLQGLTLAGAVVVPMLLVVGLLFLALWVLVLWQGARLDA